MREQLAQSHTELLDSTSRNISHYRHRIISLLETLKCFDGLPIESLERRSLESFARCAGPLPRGPRVCGYYLSTFCHSQVCVCIHEWWKGGRGSDPVQRFWRLRSRLHASRKIIAWVPPAGPRASIISCRKGRARQTGQGSPPKDTCCW